MSDTLLKLKDLLITRLKLKVEADEINEDTQLFGPGGLGLDSIDLLELIVGIKKEFGVEISDRESAEKILVSLGSITEFIEENQPHMTE
jgi:acyl carrier protein